MSAHSDIHRALRRYPNISMEERTTLRHWYRRAPFAEFVSALNDPATEAQLGKLRADLTETRRCKHLLRPSLSRSSGDGLSRIRARTTAAAGAATAADGWK